MNLRHLSYPAEQSDYEFERHAESPVEGELASAFVGRI
jgi:hypothetical protein